MNMHDVLIAPIVTEKAESLKNSVQGSQRYTFHVHYKANKELIRQALRHFYRVQAIKINVLNMRGKLKRFQRNKYRQARVKKAIVTLARGENIDFLVKK